MRIAIFTTDLSGHSGWSTYARDLSKQMAKDGHTILAIVHKKINADWCEEIAILKDAHHLVSPLVALTNIAPIRRALDAFHPDVVHCMAEPYALLLPSLQKKKGIYCMTLHGTYAITPFRSGKIVRRRMEKAMQTCDHIFSVSNFTKQHLQKMEPDLFKKMHLDIKISVVHNAIDLSAITVSPPHTSLKKSIISIGAVKERKGYREAIEAVAAYTKQSSQPCIYTIYGAMDDANDHVQKLKALVVSKGLENVVRFHGKATDAEIRHAYANADLFLLLSQQTDTNFEGFGLVFLEANARGVPVIGPNTGGCPEAIDDGKSGYICDPQDATHIAKKMQNILIEKCITASDCRLWAQQHTIQDAVRTLTGTYTDLLQPQ